MLEPIHVQGLEVLPETCDIIELNPGSTEQDLYVHGLDVEVIISRGFIPICVGFLDRSMGMRVVAVLRAGVDHVDLSAAAQRGVTVFNTPSGLTTSVAELTIGLIFEKDP